MNEATGTSETTRESEATGASETTRENEVTGASENTRDNEAEKIDRKPVTTKPIRASDAPGVVTREPPER